MHYTGTIDQSSEKGEKGKKFDSSRDRGATFDVQIGRGRVIQGWDKGLVGLCKGAKATLVIPPDMGYGDRGAGADIPGGATLNFDVEVVDIPGAADGAAPPSVAPAPAVASVAAARCRRRGGAKAAEGVGHALDKLVKLLRGRRAPPAEAAEGDGGDAEGGGDAAAVAAVPPSQSRPARQRRRRRHCHRRAGGAVRAGGARRRRSGCAARSRESRWTYPAWPAISVVNLTNTRGPAAAQAGPERRRRRRLRRRASPRDQFRWRRRSRESAPPAPRPTWCPAAPRAASAAAARARWRRARARRGRGRRAARRRGGRRRGARGARARRPPGAPD